MVSTALCGDLAHPRIGLVDFKCDRPLQNHPTRNSILGNVIYRCQTIQGLFNVRFIETSGICPLLHSFYRNAPAANLAPMLNAIN